MNSLIDYVRFTMKILYKGSYSRFNVFEFKTWKSEYRKEYSVHAGEELKRLEIWMENKARIERHNRGYIEAKQTFSLLFILFV